MAMSDSNRRWRPAGSFAGVLPAVVVLVVLTVGLVPAAVAQDGSGTQNGGQNQNGGRNENGGVNQNGQTTTPRYNGTDPERHLAAYKPKPLDVINDPAALKLETDRRAVRLSSDAIELLRGDVVLRRIAFAGSRPVAFEAVVSAVGDPTWVAQTAPGTFVLRAAFVQGRGTFVRFVAPGVQTVRLADQPHVFLGGVGARAEIIGAKITSWNERSRTVVTTASTRGRPFILYSNGSRLDIVRSEIAYLGYDRVTAYGLSLREGGSTGSVVDSEIHHMFFGLYTYQAANLVVRGNRFHDDKYYGIDPHDGSTGFLLENNDLYRNGSHGIVLSRQVVDSVVRGNHTHDNGGDGIVMDFESDRNRITGNRSEHNAGDGIVILGSSNVRVENNIVHANRVGIRVNHRGLNNVIVANQVTDNGVGAELYGGATSTTLRDNTILRSRHAGVVLDGAGLDVQGGVVDSAPTGIDVRGLSRVQGTAIRHVNTGVKAGPDAIVHIGQVRAEAVATGLDVELGAAVWLNGSYIAAPRPVGGADAREVVGTELRGPRAPISWLAIAGVAFLLLAGAFQLFHRRRHRRHGVAQEFVGGPDWVLATEDLAPTGSTASGFRALHREAPSGATSNTGQMHGGGGRPDGAAPAPATR